MKNDNDKGVQEVVICLSCGKEVTVQKISYGNGFIAICPICGQLAYSK